MEIAKPIVDRIDDNSNELKKYEQDILNSKSENEKEIIVNFPMVYIHSWKNRDGYEVYIGESNDILQRTRQHYEKMSDKDAWQHNLVDKNASLYMIGHNHFNKSMTLDIENKLMHYLMSTEKNIKVHNLRGNPQRKYYPSEEVDIILAKIWQRLRKYDKELFPPESLIKDSAVFKASPLHKLTEEQQNAKEKIIENVLNAMKNNKRGQLIFVEGEAGTGKTVLNSSTFYELICRYEEAKTNNSEGEIYEASKCCLVVNQDEQLTVYEQIANRLGLTDKYGELVYKPTRFINTHSIENPVDVVFIDEAHLLWTRGKQGYQGKNQLEDIIARAKVVVVMFDENQVLNTNQYWEDQQIESYRNKAKENQNYIKMQEQLRIHANKDVIEWINSFTKEGIIKKLPDDLGEYDIQIANSPEELEEKIKMRANNENSKLSRLIATYDWYYNSDPDSKKGICEYWEVKIDHDNGNWHKPWNRELEQTLDKKQKRKIKNLAWAEQPHTIDEVGSTYTIQGFDLDYAGVILGESVTFKDGHIAFNPNATHNNSAKTNRKLSDGTYKKFTEKFLKNELRVLMTRGVNGLYIYACDKDLREKLEECSS